MKFRIVSTGVFVLSLFTLFDLIRELRGKTKFYLVLDALCAATWGTLTKRKVNVRIHWNKVILSDENSTKQIEQWRKEGTA